MKVTRHKIRTGHYEVCVDGRVVGEVSKTGTHLDHYPWDWMLADGVEPFVLPSGKKCRVVGVSDTLAHGVDQIAHSAGAQAYRYE